MCETLNSSAGWVGLGLCSPKSGVAFVFSFRFYYVDCLIVKLAVSFIKIDEKAGCFSFRRSRQGSVSDLFPAPPCVINSVWVVNL